MDSHLIDRRLLLANHIDIDGLSRLYSQDSTARAILTLFASRTKTSKTTKLSRVRELLALAGPSISRQYHDLVITFTTLEDLGAGQYVHLTDGTSPYFTWSVNLITLSRYALEDAARNRLSGATVPSVAPFRFSRTSVDVPGLRYLFVTNPTAKLLIDLFVLRSKNSHETRLHRAMQLIAAHDSLVPSDRASVRNVFIALEQLGCGRNFFETSSGPATFVWTVPLLDVARVAAGADLPLKSRPTLFDLPQSSPSPLATATEELETTYKIALRGDYSATLSVPLDLTPAEALSLHSFISTLPISA